MRYNIYVGKIFLLLSIFSCLFNLTFLIRRSISILAENVWMTPIFAFGLLSVPYVTYAVRAYVEVIWNAYVPDLIGRKRFGLMKEHVYSSIVLPSDCDIYNHMNNSRYSREADFARTRWYCDTGLLRFMQKTGKYLIMTASTIRYRRSLEVFQSFTIATKIIYWDERNIYLQHKFLTGSNFVNSIIITRMRVLAQNKSAEEFLQEFLGTSSTLEKSPLSAELKHYLNYLETCSNNLRPSSSFVIPK
ncbi:protein THEM6-like [Styela clava]